MKRPQWRMANGMPIIPAPTILLRKFDTALGMFDFPSNVAGEGAIETPGRPSGGTEGEKLEVLSASGAEKALSSISSIAAIT